MSSISQTVREKAKAVLAAAGITLAGVAEWAVQNPDTAKSIEKIVPAPYDQLVPIILGIIGTVLVHQVPNATPTAVSFEEPSTATSILKLQQVNGGEFTGTPAH